MEKTGIEQVRSNPDPDIIVGSVIWVTTRTTATRLHEGWLYETFNLPPAGHRIETVASHYVPDVLNAYVKEG
jgi:hypothetical protein